MTVSEFDLPAWLDGFLLVLGVLGAIGTVYAVLTSAATKTRLEIMSATAAEMERAVNWERAERIRSEGECSAKIAELQGQVKVLESELIFSLVQSIKVAIVDAIHEAFDLQNDRHPSSHRSDL